MKFASTRLARRLRLLALLVPTLGWLGCGGSSSGTGPDPIRDAAAVTQTSKDNYLKSRAERKGQRPSQSGSNASRYGGRH